VCLGLCSDRSVICSEDSSLGRRTRFGAQSFVRLPLFLRYTVRDRGFCFHLPFNVVLFSSFFRLPSFVDTLPGSVR
jgi:hypothetical protein